jgi:hypothetical protein
MNEAKRHDNFIEYAVLCAESEFIRFHGAQKIFIFGPWLGPFKKSHIEISIAK